MPSQQPPRPPTRRVVLLAAAALPLAGCSLFDAEEAAPQPLPPSPDDVLRDHVVAGEEALLALYAATIEAHPELAEDLGEFTERHRRHADAIEATAPPPPATESPAALAAGVAATPDATTGQPPAVHTDPVEAVRALREAEVAAAADRLADCQSARGGELARVLAGVAACEASHDLLLRRVGG